MIVEGMAHRSRNVIVGARHDHVRPVKRDIDGSICTRARTIAT